MSKTLAQKYEALKLRVGGNREKMGYEETFGQPMLEQRRITPPAGHIVRILAELDFAIKMSGAQDGKFDRELHEALDYLSSQMYSEGVLTKSACAKAEELLAPLGPAAKEYKLILAGHAHIDMNWMWSWHETVAATLATFRTMLNIMDEYPEFCFSQSQASVYRIVEEFEPELMERIKARIAEGRWEVTASAWVETDKNMPTTESLLRHIKYTKNYLRDTWGIDVDKLEVDFSPDTFGHSANVPEIDVFGGLKYYYHCRALNGKQALYRWRGISGRELLVYREQYWYNSGITPHIGSGIIDISKRCAGLKTGLIVYGVGDHGGGPTRRDVETAIEMQSWPIYPRIKFGTFHEFFREAEAVRDKLPVVEGELNYFAQGCYTSQCRIKLGNRSTERALLSAENISAVAASKSGFPCNADKLERAWRDVLFTHFHDILTGSCVQDTREHAMGLYSNSLAVAQTQLTRAMEAISQNIDTSHVSVDGEYTKSQSEGAGVGYGVENFSGFPRAERGSGRTRIFTVFNPTTVEKHEPVELTVWDWPGDMRRIKMFDSEENPLQFQLIDHRPQEYWSHKYFRMLVNVAVKPLGYTTVVLREGELEGDYPVYFQPDHRTQGGPTNYVLENEHLRAEFCHLSGRLISLRDKHSDTEYIKEGQSAGLCFVDTERATSSAWTIGNYLRVTPVDRTVRMHYMQSGGLRRGFYAEYKVASSTAKVFVYLDKNSRALSYRAEVDWHEIGGETIPVLIYQLPLAYETDNFMYDIPAGVITRKPLPFDVPGLQFGMAVREKGLSAAIVTESKYGYRGFADGRLVATFINSSTSPDPYPERGIHKINFYVGLFDSDPKTMQQAATSLCNQLCYMPTGSHTGTLPTSGSLLGFESKGSVITSVAGCGNTLEIRVCNLTGAPDTAIVDFGTDVTAEEVDLAGRKTADAKVSGGKVTVELDAHQIKGIKISLA